MYSPGSASGIWKIAPAGAQPFAGIREQSLDPVDGRGLDAQFNSIQNMLFADGALIVNDYGRSIRRVAEDGTVTTVTLPMRPDMADNAGALYQRTIHHEQGHVVSEDFTRFDGRVTRIETSSSPV